ncbi:rod shape-determining protein MreC [Dichelobacter nodosus]|uniref:Cell shape-determining protein MreC n=1 Tax=Dichelobacter nodosus (strain VCS1703A) TaxID=246195 RepID=A5EY28_DICNV|nr:rod shape-determining protein MreC [Dichelobacter nodosus]ABQ13749.1 rod shape-determining protein MreC [Dichelobacter nodosus VCS1703A]KNZ39208.1 rod shape-determining protein MreC [Dichelobacter nodosus]TGA64484.1 rod shape-determining protein MreC [Dichelobacter nodosus]
MLTRRGWVLRTTFAAFLSLSLLIAQGTGSWLQPVQAELYQWIYHPLRAVIQAPWLNLRQYLYQWQNKKALASRCDNLLRENEMLRAQMQLLGHLQAENRRLRMLMESVANVTEPVMVAELSDTMIEGYRETVMINKGARDGVYEHQAVIDPHGLIGQVIAVYPNQAEVMLISDGRSRVPVYIERTHQRALLSGSAEAGVLTMPALRLETDIRIGDHLLSSGLGGIFPRGYPVAEVVSVNREQRYGFLQVRLKPLAHLQTMLEVLLLDRRQLADSLYIPVGPPAPEKEEEK